MILPQFDVSAIRQGHCYLVDLNPPRGSKPGKVRPAMVVQSQKTIATGSPAIAVVPLTSVIDDPDATRVHVRPGPGLLLEKPSDILIYQLQTLDRQFFYRDLGKVSSEIFEKVKAGLRVYLDLY